MQYFKREGDFGPGPGPGVVWFEFDGERPNRQVERYGEQWFSSRYEYHPGLGPGLSDVPLSVSRRDGELSDEHECSAAEFEQAWAEAGKRGG